MKILFFIIILLLSLTVTGCDQGSAIEKDRPFGDIPSEIIRVLGNAKSYEEKISSGKAEQRDYWYLGIIYYGQNKNEKVVDCMNHVLEMDTKKTWHGAYSYRGRALFLLGQKEARIKDLIEASGRGMSEAASFLEYYGIEWDGPEKERYHHMIYGGSGVSVESGKNFAGRDRLFNNLRDDINNSDMSFSEKANAKVKLHDDLYKE